MLMSSSPSSVGRKYVDVRKQANQAGQIVIINNREIKNLILKEISGASNMISLTEKLNNMLVGDKVLADGV